MEAQDEKLVAIELFSGIGGWHAATHESSSYRIVRAYDQNHAANTVYEAWHDGLKPSTKDVTRLTDKDLAADIWLASPPCQPFTAGGLRKDDQDLRSAALLHLIDVISRGGGPRFLAMENVPLFKDSMCHARLISALDTAGFTYGEYVVSPEELGVPNRRLRYYLVAASREEKRTFPKQFVEPQSPPPSLREFFCDSGFSNGPPLHASWAENKSGFKFHCVSGESTLTQCFTKSYFESKNNGGSYIVCSKVDDNDGYKDNVANLDLRFFSPNDILRLMCFPTCFSFDNAQTPLKSQYKLVGNSVNCRVVQRLLEILFEQ
jgi:site-specific DNA-cytosine methylase